MRHSRTDAIRTKCLFCTTSAAPQQISCMRYISNGNQHFTGGFTGCLHMLGGPSTTWSCTRRVLIFHGKASYSTERALHAARANALTTHTNLIAAALIFCQCNSLHCDGTASVCAQAHQLRVNHIMTTRCCQVADVEFMLLLQYARDISCIRRLTCAV